MVRDLCTPKAFSDWARIELSKNFSLVVNARILDGKNVEDLDQFSHNASSHLIRKWNSFSPFRVVVLYYKQITIVVGR